MGLWDVILYGTAIAAVVALVAVVVGLVGGLVYRRSGGKGVDDS
tara:strand:+ start:361 stop:492 length:132 start_codon:yes stop_codon:yes gene_type:complete